MTHYQNETTFMGHMTQILAMDGDAATGSMLGLCVIDWDQVGFIQTSGL